MPKINNKGEYPIVSEANVSLADFLIGTVAATGQTRTFPISIIKALIEGKQVKIVNLSNATSYQNNDFVGANDVYGFTQGQEIKTGGMISSFDDATGEVAFDSAFTPFTGEIIFVTA